MKKIILIAVLLFICVVTSACINNFAVQELNEKAKIYAEKGEYEEAIARLKSALDLDSTSFETYYNLGSVYSKNQDWEHAIESYAQVISLKPELADAYYSLAVSEENAAGTIINSSDELTPEEKKLAYDLTQKAIQDYQTYLAKAPDAKDKKEVEQSIEQLKGMFSSIEVDTDLLRRL